MSEAYWLYKEGRQQPVDPPSLGGKQSRPGYEIAGGSNMSSMYVHEDETGRHCLSRDGDPMNALCDRYLQTSQISSYTGGVTGRSMNAGLGGHHPIEDPRHAAIGVSEPVVAAKSRAVVEAGRRPEIPVVLGEGRPEVQLPPDASSTLFVEGLPANCTRREVSHIFRPFIGYLEARLVNKQSRHSGGDSVVFCFVDFVSPAHAATALDALQGYRFDELDHDSDHLRLQFARYPGARSGGGHRVKH